MKWKTGVMWIRERRIPVPGSESWAGRAAVAMGAARSLPMRIREEVVFPRGTVQAAARLWWGQRGYQLGGRLFSSRGVVSAELLQEAIARGLCKRDLEEVAEDTGDTPLILAARNGDAEGVRVLLKAGASLRARNKVQAHACVPEFPCIAFWHASMCCGGCPWIFNHTRTPPL